MECNCEWCDKTAKFKGYCEKHYRQIKRLGGVRRTYWDKNEILMREHHAEIILYDKTNSEKGRAIIDLDDVERCKDYKWHLTEQGYVATTSNKKTLRLHRFIMITPDDMHTDHLNRNKLDNRKENLLICTQSENNKNKGVYSKNTLGKRGVSYRDGRYYVQIRFEYKNYHLGIFKELNDAIKARENAELKFYGYILKD